MNLEHLVIPKMPLHFLHNLPREIRDQIYTCVLASPSGFVTLSPWTLELSRSLSLLQTCHQIHRECKDLIWQHTGLRFADPSQLYRKLLRIGRHMKQIRRITFRLELLDRDELEWMVHSLTALTEWCRAGRLACITLVTTWERPRDIVEFREVLALRKAGEVVDGRYLCISKRAGTELNISTAWPKFSHWGKQRGLKAILLDSSGTSELFRAIHEIFGGELYVDGVLIFKDQKQTVTSINSNTQNGGIRILPGSSFVSRHNMNRTQIQ